MAERPDWKRVIGIMGGLGPFAHIELERLVLAATERVTDRPPHDQDYPAWISSSVPATPDRTLALLEGGPSSLPVLVESARRVSAQVPIPFISMVQETAASLTTEFSFKEIQGC